MNTVKDHYDHHLANFYSWMVGDFDARRIEQENYFRSNKIHPQRTGVAIDLGCGHGIQSVALANLGFKVRAVDFNTRLLAELEVNGKEKSIERLESDILNEHLYMLPVDVIVCMGDTLTHLASKEYVRELVRRITGALAEGGKLVFSFRDLTHELTGDQRFLPVRSDENRIHTCFLEYFPDGVRVTDILHERKEGFWEMKTSSYSKLKLTSIDISNYLDEMDFAVVAEETIQRMIYLVAEKKKAPSKDEAH